MTTEHAIIVRCDIGANPGGIRVDIGNLSPAVAAICLTRAADALELQPEPIVTIVHDDQEIAVVEDTAFFTLDDDDE